MITLEESGVDYTYIDMSEYTTLQKMYYMARPEPIDLVQGEDGVFRIERPSKVHDFHYSGHMADAFDYYAYTKWAGIYFTESI